MNNKHNFIEDNLLIFSKQTADLFLQQKKPYEIIALYFFYYYTAKWQRTNQPKCTTSFVTKGLGWSEDRTIRTKKVLIDLGLIEDMVCRDEESGKIVGHFIKLNYIWKTETVKSIQNKNHPLEKPPGGETCTNALSACSLNALNANKNPETQKTSFCITETPFSKEVKKAITKKSWPNDSIEYEISRLLLNKILKRSPDYFGAKVVFKGVGYEEKIQSMCIDFDRLLRLDKRDPEETIDVILWCQADPFWSQNINSSYKFREQYSRLRDGMSDPSISSKKIEVVDIHPELTTKIKRLYAQKILGDIAINCSDADNEKFIKAGARTYQFAEKWDVNLINISGYLINCLVNNFVDHGEPVHPGNLCSDNTWNILLPQYLKEIGIRCKKGK
jgi:hypothetical protein